MEQSGRTYYLNREESKQLLKNDLFPVREEWEKRNRFLEETERTMQLCEPDAQGRVFWRDSTVNEENIGRLLKEGKQTSYYTEQSVFINVGQVRETIRKFTMMPKNVADKELVLA